MKEKVALLIYYFKHTIWELLQYRKLRSKDYLDQCCILDMPFSKNSNEEKTKDVCFMYQYYWFAENIQYFHIKLKLIKGFLHKIQYRQVEGMNFAVLPLTYDFDGYMQDCIKSPERALVRKAIKNGYSARQINYDEYVDDIREINMSKGERQGHAMGIDYVEVKQREKIVKPLNSKIYTYGCFSPEGKLVAYYVFEHFSNFIHVGKGIGHSEHLKMGIMNYLFAFCIAELTVMHRGDSLIYGYCSQNASDGLSKFKFNVGCRISNIVYRGTSSDFYILKRFNSQYNLHGDSAMNFVLDYIKPILCR